MEIQTEQTFGNTIIRLIGNMDVHAVHKIEKQFMDELSSYSRTKIIIDLSRVDFVSSAGLRILVGALKICKEKDNPLILCCLKPSVQKVFEILDMNSMFEVRKTVSDAIT